MLGYVLGVGDVVISILQIDNMTTGLVQRTCALQNPCAMQVYHYVAGAEQACNVVCMQHVNCSR